MVEHDTDRGAEKLRTEERTGLSESEAKKRLETDREGTERSRERAKRAFGGGFWLQFN